MAAAQEADALRKQLKELQRKLDEKERQNEDLVRDLEAVCLSDGGATFSSSSVLQERIICAERELAAVRAALSSATAERNGLREDLHEVKEAKRRADQGYKAQLERAGALDKELAFYQAQSARVMSDRDRAVWEGEELRAANLQLEAQLREASGRAETQASQREEVARQLAETQAQLRAAQARAAEAEALPGLRAELAASEAEASRLAERERQLQAEGEGLQQQLAAARAAADTAAAEAAEHQRSVDQLAAAHAVVQQQLRSELAEQQSEVARLREELAAAQADAVAAHDAAAAGEAAMAELRLRQEADVAALVRHHGEEVEALRRQLGEQQAAVAAGRESIEEATRQKVAALMRLSDAEGRLSKADGRIEQLVKQLAANGIEDGSRHQVAASPARSDSANKDSPTKPSPHASPAQPPRRGGWWGSSSASASPVKG